MRATISECGAFVCVPKPHCAEVSRLPSGDHLHTLSHPRLDGGYATVEAFADREGSDGAGPAVAVRIMSHNGWRVEFSLANGAATRVVAPPPSRGSTVAAGNGSRQRPALATLVNEVDGLERERDRRRFNLEWLEQECVPEAATEAQRTGSNADYIALVNGTIFERSQLAALNAQIADSRLQITELTAARRSASAGAAFKQVKSSVLNKIPISGFFTAIKRVVLQ